MKCLLDPVCYRGVWKQPQYDSARISRWMSYLCYWAHNGCLEQPYEATRWKMTDELRDRNFKMMRSLCFLTRHMWLLPVMVPVLFFRGLRVFYRSK